MDMTSMYRHFVIGLIFYTLSSAVWSACTQENIAFYLEKGFTQDQITQLCSAGTSDASVPDYTPYQQTVVIYSDGAAPGIKGGFTKEEREAIETLKKGTAIYNLKVNPETIFFVRRVCIVTGNAKDVDARTRDCPKVNFTIKRENLLVQSSGKTMGVFGKGEVTLAGDIVPELAEGSWDDYNVEVREGLQRDFEWRESTSQTTIPVRGDFSITRVANAFRALSLYEQNENVPGESMLDKQQPEQVAERDQSKTEDKKKKKWWNPFD